MVQPRDIGAGAVRAGKNFRKTKTIRCKPISWPSAVWTHFPNSVGGRMCFNLLRQIEAKSADISTERVWNEPMPSIRVTYRNVDKVFFRAVPYNYDEFITTLRWSTGYLDESNPKAPGSKTGPCLVGRSAADHGFQRTVEKLPAPGNLKPGILFPPVQPRSLFRGE